jgi:hypothetical protein
MQTHVFSEAQATHALEVVLKLMREKRYFLYRQTESRVKDPEYNLEPEVFGPALELDEKIRAIYVDATQEAEDAIRVAEQDLGVVEPDLSKNKKVVECSRYTGGLDICRVYPLTAFARFAPRTLQSLEKQMLREMMGEKTKDNLAPNKLRELRDQAKGFASVIWTQLEALEIRDPSNLRCIVLMKTRFNSSGNLDGDFMEGKVLQMQEFSHALGYLFNQFSKYARIVQHSHIVFSTSRLSHVNMQHWEKEKARINYNDHDGYDCKIHFVTVL